MRDRELKRRLRAIREPSAPPSLEARLEQDIPESAWQPESWWSPRRWWTMAAASAAVIVMAWMTAGLVLGPGVTTATFAATLEPAVAATSRANAAHVVLNMLTRQGEDFSYVNLDGELERVEAWVEWPLRPEDPGRARIDKLDRIYRFDGEETIFYHPKRNEAFRGAGRGVDLDLFWPAAWVRQIQNLPDDDVEVLAHEEKGGKGWLVLREKGASIAPLEPSFLGDFDRETEVEWDLKTERLTGLKRWVYVDGERRLFSELVVIDYLPSLDDRIFELDVPDDVRWGGVKKAPIELATLGPREVAKTLFAAAQRGDRATLEMFCGSPNMVDFLLEDRHRPTEILFIGEPFQAGDYPGVYVPYKIRLGSNPSAIKAFNLALRNDNKHHRWLFDGGI